MNRIFLAVMALLAGLCAQVAPSAARLSEDTQIGAAVDVGTLDRQTALQVAIPALRPSQGCALDTKAGQIARSAQVAVLAAVLIGIDRARE